jgi:hypothetical protein
MVTKCGVKRDTYVDALGADVLGISRKLITACRASGGRRADFAKTIIEGNKNKTWRDDDGHPTTVDPVQLLRDCGTRWSSTHLMADQVLNMLPVCFVVTFIAFVPS